MDSLRAWLRYRVQGEEHCGRRRKEERSEEGEWEGEGREWEEEGREKGRGAERRKLCVELGWDA
jgi:hypothetical protein